MRTIKAIILEKKDMRRNCTTLEISSFKAAVVKRIIKADMAFYDNGPELLIVKNRYVNIKLDALKINLPNQVTKEDIDELREYFNKVTRSNITERNNGFKDLAIAKLQEYGMDAVKRVILFKTADWQNSEMDQYLTAQTLFSGKFVKYIDQIERLKHNPHRRQEIIVKMQAILDESEMDKLIEDAKRAIEDSNEIQGSPD